MKNESVKGFAFYIDSSVLNRVNLEEIHKGNPGMGGTEYTSLFTANCLRHEGYRISVYSPNQFIEVDNFEITPVSSFLDAAERSAQNGELLFYKPTVTVEDKLFSIPKDLNVSLAPWCHLTPSQHFLRYCASDDRVKVLVCLGNNQALKMRDNPVWRKVVILPNLLPIFPTLFEPEKIRKENIKFVYLGALVPAKGFHILARQWSRVIEKIPSARLVVIGGADLYRDFPEFEIVHVGLSDYILNLMRMLEPYKDSITFTGVISEAAKNKWLSDCDLGIVNPSGRTEVLSSSAIELQNLGIPVISRRRNGMVDVVRHNHSGILFLNENRLGRHMIKLAKNRKKRIELSKGALRHVEERFRLGVTLPVWLTLAQSLTSDRFEQISCPSLKHLSYTSVRGIFVLTSLGIVKLFGYRFLTVEESRVCVLRKVLKCKEILKRVIN